MKPTANKVYKKLDKKNQINLSLDTYEAKVNINQNKKSQRNHAQEINAIIDSARSIRSKLDGLELVLANNIDTADKALKDLVSIKRTLSENGFDTSAVDRREKEILSDKAEIKNQQKVLQMHKKRLRSL